MFYIWRWVPQDRGRTVGLISVKTHYLVYFLFLYHETKASFQDMWTFKMILNGQSTLESFKNFISSPNIRLRKSVWIKSVRFAKRTITGIWFLSKVTWMSKNSTLDHSCSLKCLWSVFFSRDFLTITNEANRVFGVYCGQKSGEKVIVNGSYALMIFHTDSDIQRRGFWIHFSTLPILSK